MDPNALQPDGNWEKSAYIISAVIGPGVFAMARAMAHLGWVASPVAMLLFAFLAYYMSRLLCRCCHDFQLNQNSYCGYGEVVRTTFGAGTERTCGWLLCLQLIGVAIGYTIAASINIMALMGLNHKISSGQVEACDAKPYMLAFGVAQIILSQLPELNLKSWTSVMGIVLCSIYSGIGIGLAIVKITENHMVGGSLTGIPIAAGFTPYDKMWSSFRALGDIAFAYTYSMALLEIQGRERPLQSEVSTMERAGVISAIITSVVYILQGVVGYAAFGDSAPKYLLFGLSDQRLIIKIAIATSVIHLIISYQGNCKPLFAFVEKGLADRFPYIPRIVFRLIWRTAFVAITTAIPIFLPSDDFGALLEAFSFWPLVVHFPVAIYIKQKNIPSWSKLWWALQIIRFLYLVIAMAACAGYIAGFISHSP